MESKGEVCLEEEVERLRRSGMTTDGVPQKIYNDRWSEQCAGKPVR